MTLGETASLATESGCVSQRLPTTTTSILIATQKLPKHVITKFISQNSSFPTIIHHRGCVPGGDRAVPVPSPREGLRSVQGYPDPGARRVGRGRRRQCGRLRHRLLHHVLQCFADYECYSSTYPN